MHRTASSGPILILGVDVESKLGHAGRQKARRRTGVVGCREQAAQGEDQHGFLAKNNKPALSE